MEMTLGLTALSTTLSLMALWALFHWLYRDYRVDLFRQRMFALRDELFELAASGRIAFDDPAYGKLRSMLNGYIRFAHRISVPLLLSASRSRHALSQGAEEATALTTAVRAQPPETAEFLARILSQTHWYVAEQLLLTSLLMWLVLVPIAVYVLMRTLGEKALRFMRRWPVWRWLKSHFIEPMDSAALTAAG
jgi:hypothetical protein